MARRIDARCCRIAACHAAIAVQAGVKISRAG